MSDTVTVRHDAELKVTFYERGLRSHVLSVDTVKAYLLDAHITMQTVCYGGVSGMVRWSDPKTGKPLQGVSYHYELVNPDRDILTDGQLCDCTEVCLPQLQGA